MRAPQAAYSGLGPVPAFETIQPPPLSDILTAGEDPWHDNLKACDLAREKAEMAVHREVGARGAKARKEEDKS
jgi:hypothetical protein